MATEETAQQETAPMDSALQSFYDFIPESEKGGESPAAPAEESKPDSVTPEAQGDTTAEADKPAEEQKPAADTTAPDGGEQGDKGAGAPAFDLNKYFEESSEGLVKTEDDFKASITKIKDYDTLAEKVKVLEAEKETIFANDFIKKLNALHKEGRSQEQIDSFVSLSRLDLTKIDPKEALVQNEILNNGHTRAIAERIVSKKYGLDKLSIDDDTLTDEEIAANKAELETVQAIMSNDAKPIVDDLKKQLDGLSNSVSPEQKALDEAARKKSYEKALEPFADQLVKDFPTKLALSPEEGVELTYDMPEDFTATIKDEAKEYFNHPDMQVNAETVQEFVTLKKALYLYSKQKEIITHFYEQGKALGVKEATAKFENAGGVSQPDADVEVTADNIDETLMAIAQR